MDIVFLSMTLISVILDSRSNGTRCESKCITPLTHTRKTQSNVINTVVSVNVFYVTRDTTTIDYLLLTSQYRRQLLERGYVTRVTNGK